MTTHAWQRPTDGEHRWPVALVVFLTVAAQLTVPDAYSVGPHVLAPAVEIALLMALFIRNPHKIHLPHPHLRYLSIALTAVMTMANVVSSVRLVIGLLSGQVANDPFTLIRVGGTIWLINIVVMALWYWELDRGGPSARARNVRAHTDFLFPQMTAPAFAGPDWEPVFLDYLYTSFTNATAFSPTDVLPLTRWAKVLMMLQSPVSLSTVALIIARAVNTLR